MVAGKPLQGNSFCFANCLALSAANAVDAVRILPNRDIEFADFLAGFALTAFFRIDFELIKRYFVKYAVDCSERANVAAERAVYND